MESTNPNGNLKKRSRYLTNDEDVWENNAWDDVEWTEDYLIFAAEKVKNYSSQKSEYDLSNLHQSWDEFYKRHQNKFFKDKNWILQEFYPLNDAIVKNGEKCKILEVGCGVGNVAFPLLECFSEKLMYYCCDFSANAIQIIKDDQRYPVDVLHPFVCDITDDNVTFPFEEDSLDFIIAIFVMSAISPTKLDAAVANLSKYLKKSTGILLFRDFGQYDLTQLRFKASNYLDENLYRRNDGTLTHFFTTEFIDNLFTKHGLVKIQNQEDKRLIVNRKKKIKMYRNWIQAIYRRQ